MSKIRKRSRSGERGINRISDRLHGLLSGLLSNFRLSLTFRISLHYCSQLVRTTFSTLVIFTLALILLQIPSIHDDVLRLQEVEASASLTFDQNAVQNSRAQAWLTQPAQDQAGEEYFTLNLDTDSGTLAVIVPHNSGLALHVSYQLNSAVFVWICLALTLVFTDILRMLYFVRKHSRLDKHILTPICEISDMAATLSASNLSNRINVAGMKNELKELAVVINTMLDRIERSYNSQKQFVSDASHELRTPIAVIQGYVSMLERWGKGDPTVLDEGLTAIAQETASMKDLVESLLFLARHDKKTLMLELSRFDVLEVLSELHREASMVTPEDTFVLSPADSVLIDGDRGMIKQVMRILCDNAVKYTPKGGQIVLGVARTSSGCTLTVTDNGSGIPEKELPKIFDRFYRSESARKAENSGHGLGLSIARIIVIAHGGKLHVRSKVGAGTTFSIELPARQHSLHTADLGKSA
ncbi:MAG: HAMP domain-containing histidine kinase [Clostridia bacterium]|nr:HAMP domain-containing histidine kinase [Clostridia bacterium]